MISGSDQLIDPGAGNHTLQFLQSAGKDSLVLHVGGTELVSGFDVSKGDRLDLSTLFAESGINLGSDLGQIVGYVTVAEQSGATVIDYDPTRHSGGAVVAVLSGEDISMAHRPATDLFVLH